jgi:glyoxylase-like metal-dependent hydrolase (beta-lactamase superfamily II)
MILKKLILSSFGTNCYIVGSSETKEVFILDPGGEPELIKQTVEELGAKPVAIIFTHGHMDHTTKASTIKREYKIPIWYAEKDVFQVYSTKKKADRILNEGDVLKAGEISLHVLETPGHSADSICMYIKKEIDVDGKKFDGVMFTGDLIFRRSIGRTDMPGGDQYQLFSNIKNKIMNNPELTDNYLLCPGHMGNTTIGEERQLNMFKQYFT